MTIKLPYPTLSVDTNDKDMIELKKYLFRFVDELNNDLNILLTYSGAIDASNTNTTTVTGILNNAMNNLSLELRALITNNNRIVDNKITTIEQTYLKSSDFDEYEATSEERFTNLETASAKFSTTNDLNSLPNLPSDWPEGATGRVVIYGSETEDRFYTLFSTSCDMWNGYKNTSSENITWKTVTTTIENT